MLNLFRQFLHLLGLGRQVKPVDSPLNQNFDSYEDLDLSVNLAQNSIDIVFAINQISVIPAKNLAQQKNSLTIVDLDQIPSPNNLDNARMKSALGTADLLFAANRKLATELEDCLNRHIIISRHLTYQASHQKYIDLKKVYHLIDETQLMVFDASTAESLIDDFEFIASLLSKLPRYIHLIITGEQAENEIFNQQKNLFQQYNCTSRVHFYVDNLAAIKYPIDYASIDMALLLSQQQHSTPTQYYKYLHEEVSIFSTAFADSNQLITSADIGQVFENQNADQWAAAINLFLNLSETKRDENSDRLRVQKQNINWQQESDHFLSSIINAVQPDNLPELNAVIVDLSKNKITNRTHDIGHMLVEQGINVRILAPFLPLIHAPQTSNIEYIKVS